MRHKLMSGLTGNLGLKAIALALAFLIWLFVSNNNDPIGSSTYSNIPINIVNDDSIADIGKVVEPEGSGTVTVKVTERRSVRNRLARNGSSFYVEADLENINEMNTVPLTITCENAAVTWDEMEIMPSSLKVTLEDKVEQAFAVTAQSTGETAAGYTVGTMEVLEGKNILIAGPESLVSIIDRVTAPVSVAGMQEDKSLTAQLRVYDKNGSELTDSQMTRLEFKDSSGNMLTEHSVTVKVDLWEVHPGIALDVRTTGLPADGYRVKEVKTIPETVTLAGTAEAFDALGDVLPVNATVSVAGASENVTAIIDLTETLAANVELKLPADADPAVSVEAVIEKSGDITVEIPISSLVLENKPEGMKLVFTPAEKISIDLHALDVDSGAARPEAEDITATLDLSSCAVEGSYQLPIDITLPEGYELSGEETIRVIAERSKPAETSIRSASSSDEDETETSAAADDEDGTETSSEEQEETEEAETEE